MYLEYTRNGNNRQYDNYIKDEFASHVNDSKSKPRVNLEWTKSKPQLDTNFQKCNPEQTPKVNPLGLIGTVYHNIYICDHVDIKIGYPILHKLVFIAIHWSREAR